MPKQEAAASFAVGHIALGYILAQGSSKLVGTKIALPIVITLSIIPDIDILFPFIQHRGLTHSLLSATALFLPAFIVWRRQALPYFIALVQHSLLGDYLGGGGLKLLWPVINTTYGLRIDIKGTANVILELLVFLVASMIVLKTKDLTKLFEPKALNLILIVPTVAVLLPTFFAFPFPVPFILVIPHLIYLAAFLLAIVASIMRFKPRNGVHRRMNFIIEFHTETERISEKN